MATLSDFLNNNRFNTLSEAANKFRQSDIALNKVLNNVIKDNPEVINQLSNYNKENQFTNSNSFSLGLPGGLSKMDFTAWLNLTKLNLQEIRRAPYKLVNLLGFTTLFHLMNPSWREGQIINPLKFIPRPPLLGGVEMIPDALDKLGAPSHEDLVRKRDDLMKTYTTTSRIGANTVHGPFDTPIQITSKFPFVYIGGMPFAESQKWPPGVSIQDMNNALNPNSEDFKYPEYAPVSMDKMATIDDKKKFYDGIYLKREKVNVANAALADLNKMGYTSITKVPWKNDLDSWDEYEIIESKEIKNKIPELFIPIFLTDLRTRKTAIMKPYIKRITQDFNPNWNMLEHFNRVDSIPTYKNTRRNFNIDLMFVANSKNDLDLLREKTSFIENLVYPMFDKDLNFISAPVCRIRLGDLIDVNFEEYDDFFKKSNITQQNMDALSLGCPGIITQINYDYSETFPWQIQEGLKTLQVFGISLSMILFHDYLRGQIKK